MNCHVTDQPPDGTQQKVFGSMLPLQLLHCKHNVDVIMLTFDIHGISRPSSTNRRGWILFHKRPIGETIPSYFALVHTMRGGKYP